MVNLLLDHAKDVCPELFELDEGSIAHIIGSERVDNNDELEIKDEKCGVDAAESCPVMIIHVYEDGEGDTLKLLIKYIKNE